MRIRNYTWSYKYFKYSKYETTELVFQAVAITSIKRKFTK